MLKGYPLQFNIYAETEKEVEDCRMSIVRFISEHGAQGRAVTAKKIEQAVSNWDKNPIVKNRIIQFLK